MFLLREREKKYFWSFRSLKYLKMCSYLQYAFNMNSLLLPYVNSVYFFLSNLRRNICDKVDIWGKIPPKHPLHLQSTDVFIVLGVSVWGRGKLEATPERSAVCCIVSSVISSLSACERCMRLWSCVYFLSDWVTDIQSKCISPWMMNACELVALNYRFVLLHPNTEKYSLETLQCLILYCLKIN